MTRATGGGAEAGAEERPSYHHGDLRQALITAGEAVLAERGSAGFTLRECARRAGVSPAAPAHHFGNAVGLLTAIAARGFDDLSAAMEAAVARAERDGSDRLTGICAAYLAEAMAHPARFKVTFGHLGLKPEDDDFGRAAGRAFGILVRETRIALGRPVDIDLTRKPPHYADDPDLPAILLVWSVTQGFSMLLTEGQLGFLGEGKPAGHWPALYRDRLVALLVAALRAAGEHPLANPGARG